MSEQTKHTPGPWVHFELDGKCVAIMPAGRCGNVCTFATLPNDADASLIIAAPNMLRALRVALLWMEAFESEPMTGGEHKELEAETEIVRAAIAKATGATP